MSMHYHSPLATHFEAGLFNRLSANRIVRCWRWVCQPAKSL